MIYTHPTAPKAEVTPGYTELSMRVRENWSPQAHKIADKLGQQLDAEVAATGVYTHPTAVNPAVVPYYPEPEPTSNEFTDSEGEVFRADASDEWFGDSVITLSVLAPDDDEPTEIRFFAKDTAKIIALIAEAAK